ncbi:hypothetical protein Fcan01_26106 [Folsomia candida]|uniref:DUF6570 domain-containing protein n=1 Tax=Folsomia candida TaxID=158441 RepID=A0A226D2J8_FOLCA|nr:hypothetical protein Fcan01_26106 [Folsomia candida]
MRRKREDDDFRRAEAPKNAIAKKLQRMDENMRHQEQQRDRVGRAERRSDDIYREEEKERDRMHHATRREDESYRDIEKERDRIKHATRRDDTYFKQAEQQQNTIRKAISRHRAQADFDILCKSFQSEILDQPRWICGSCGGLWYRSSMHPTTIEVMRKLHLKKPFAHLKVDGKYFLCGTCHDSLKSGDVPRLCMSNGLYFPPIPHQLQNMTSLEERLVALRLPFAQIRSLGSDRQ